MRFGRGPLLGVALLLGTTGVSRAQPGDDPPRAALERQAREVERLRARLEAQDAKLDRILQLLAAADAGGQEGLRKQLDGLRAALQDREALLRKQESLLDESRREMALLARQVEVEMQRRREDVEAVRKALLADQANAAKQQEARSEALQRLAAVEIERNNLRERAQQLEAENRRLSEELVRPRSDKSPAVPGVPGRDRNPPPEDLEGRVTLVSQDGLLKLDVGSDRGLREGHTLEVYRLSNAPGQSKYLGTLRVVKVGPADAVGQMQTRPADAVRVGDQVASRILKK